MKNVLQKIILVILSLLYIAAGINHFRNPAPYLSIMPPYIPFHAFMITLTGVIEIVLGILVLPAKTRKYASYGIILLLILFIPVHVYMITTKGCPSPDFCIEPWLAWVRLFPLQFILIWWAFVVGRYKFSFGN